jgi:hypothetical protein
MGILFASASASLSVAFLAAITMDAVINYGLLTVLIGMIAWSKYTEPPLGNPYAEVGASATGARGPEPAATEPARIEGESRDSVAAGVHDADPQMTGRLDQVGR